MKRYHELEYRGEDFDRLIEKAAMGEVQRLVNERKLPAGDVVLSWEYTPHYLRIRVTPKEPS